MLIASGNECLPLLDGAYFIFNLPSEAGLWWAGIGSIWICVGTPDCTC